MNIGFLFFFSLIFKSLIYNSICKFLIFTSILNEYQCQKCQFNFSLIYRISLIAFKKQDNRQIN